MGEDETRQASFAGGDERADAFLLCFLLSPLEHPPPPRPPQFSMANESIQEGEEVSLLTVDAPLTQRVASEGLKILPRLLLST